MPDEEKQEKIRKMSGELVIEVFVRNLEVATSELQLDFYNTMNVLYKKKIEEIGDLYDLETNLKDLRASIKTRTLYAAGMNTNPFNSDVYEEDDYVMAENKPLKREQVEDLMMKLSDNKDPKEFYKDFLKDYKRHFDEDIKEEIKDRVKVPDYKKAKDKKEAEDMKADYELRLSIALKDAIEEFDEIYKILKFFSPDKAVIIPEEIEKCSDTDADGNPFVPSSFNTGKFVGVKLNRIAKEIYSPMNIELIFCQLEGKPKLTLKPTKRNMDALEWIMLKSESIPAFQLAKINLWEVDENKRTIIRLFTGNILGAYPAALNMIARNEALFGKTVDFLKFTTYDESSIRVGIKLNMKRYIALDPSRTPVEYAFNNPLLVDRISQLTDDLYGKRNTTENISIKYYHNSKDFWIYIFGGKIGGKTKKLFYHKAYEDPEVERFANDCGFNNYRTTVSFTPSGAMRRTTVAALVIKTILTTDENIKNLKALFLMINSLGASSISITGDTKTDFLDRPDLFKAEVEGAEEEKEGEYKYDTIEPYDLIKDKIESFSRFDKYIRTSNYGTVYLKSKAKVSEAIGYGLIPLSHNTAEMVKDAFAVIINDSDKIRLQEEVSKAIKDGKSGFDIGRLVQKELKGKVGNLKTIFGLDGDDLEFIGNVFIAYSKGEIKIEEGKPKGKDEEREVPKRKLDIKTAEEFLILLNYKVKQS
jgi:hypothetical protein